MRWIAFVILAVAAVALQMSIGAAMRIPLGDGGLALAIDFLAILAVLTALRVGDGFDAILAGWVLGLLIDLTTVNLPIGLHALTYALAAAFVYQSRGSVFSESPLTQALLALGFCLIAHGLARTFVDFRVRPDARWLGRDLLQAALVALTTAAATPMMLGLLRHVDWLIMDQPAWRRR